MADESQFPSFVVPGTFVRVRAEGLITAGGVPTGNIGIVGTANKVPADTQILNNYAGAVDAFDTYDAYTNGAGVHNLTRALEILFANGAGTVFARGVAAKAD